MFRSDVYSKIISKVNHMHVSQENGDDWFSENEYNLWKEDFDKMAKKKKAKKIVKKKKKTKKKRR